MQEHFLCTLRVYCTKSMVELQPLPLLVDFEDLPYPRGRSYAGGPAPPRGGGIGRVKGRARGREKYIIKN